MTTKLTQEEIDSLADIIWWIKGYTAGANESCECCPFGGLHIAALRKARVMALEHNEKEE